MATQDAPEAAARAGRGASRTIAAVAAVAAGVATTFALAILLLGNPGVGLHEIAGLLLLVVTALLLVLTWRAPPPLRRLLPLAGAAIVTLVVMGGTGAALATGALPAAYDALPLAILAVYVALCAGIAVTAARGGDPTAAVRP